MRNLLAEGRDIWGEIKLTLGEIIVRLGKVFGDICHWERSAEKDKGLHTDQELKKEMGNLIFSSIRFCDDLGYDPEECLKIAIDCQKKFKK